MRVLLVSLLCFCGAVSAEQWVRVEPADRPITVGANGIVVSAGALRFGPPPSYNWSTSIMQLAREGSKVNTGDVLARFDDSAADDRVRDKTAELKTKRSELVSLSEAQSREKEEVKVALAAAASAAEKASRKAEGSAKLYAGLEYQKLLEEKAIADELYELERKRGQLVERVRESRRAELEADIRRLESEVDVAQKELETLAIRAPRDGLVIVGTDSQGQKLDINDVVNPGMIVVELANEDDLVVWAEVPEYAAASLDIGQVARVAFDANGGNVTDGTVISVARIVRRQSQYSQAMVRDVTVQLPEHMIAKLRPGMSAKLDIVVDTQKHALTVPIRSLVYRDGKPGVLVRDDGWRPVKLGRSSAGQRIIEAGIESGDEVAM
jgi:HlyD family secretion protein